MRTETPLDIPEHPAPFSDSVLYEFRDLLRRLSVRTILDPFAGIGRIHELRPRWETWGVEREPEWAVASPYTTIGDALELTSMFAIGEVDVIATSPCFGNRMADHHEAKDNSRRNTYRHLLGREIESGSSAILQWGDEYREFHVQAWEEATALQTPWFILNIKDHIRKGEIQPVTKWHFDELRRQGWHLLEDVRIKARGNRYGANHDLRIDHETVALFGREA